MQNKFAEQLKELRIKKGVYQRQISELLNITDTQYQRYESGKQFPKMDTLITLADYFEVSLDTLIGRNTSFKIFEPDEIKLLNTYNELNLSGKERLMQYSNDLLCSGNYKKTSVETFNVG